MYVLQDHEFCNVSIRFSPILERVLILLFCYFVPQQVSEFFLFWIDCWKPDPHDRPRFPNILQSLERIARSDFPRTAVDSFRSLQDKWKSEIERIFEELKEKEKEISSREEELVKIEIDQRRLEEHLKSKELELQERERVLLEREIVIAVQVRNLFNLFY